MDKRYGSVPRRSERQIERLASAVRRELGVLPSERLAMQPVIEFALEEMVPDAYFEIGDENEMGGAEGRTDWHRPVITLSPGTYVALGRGHARARMTAAHELGHLLMHTRQPIFYYRQQAKRREFNAEWQADTFAAALLMPAVAMRKMSTVSQVMDRFGVSRSAALTRGRRLNIRLIDDLTRHLRKKGHGMTRAP